MRSETWKKGIKKPALIAGSKRSVQVANAFILLQDISDQTGPVNCVRYDVMSNWTCLPHVQDV